MDTASIVRSLESNRETFQSLLADAPPALQQWRSSPERWNLLEITCHLYDEERDDFRARVRSVLTDPTQALPPADPQSWVQSRAYATQNYIERLTSFLAERTESVQWLRSVGGAGWENTYHHPKVGPVTASMLLANWLAHDLLHIRQIVRLKFRHLEQSSGVSLDYAGTW